MNLQDDQHLSNSLPDQNCENSAIKSSNQQKKRGRPKGVRKKGPRKRELTPIQKREQELKLKKQSVVVKRAEYTRNLPKSYPAIDDYGLETAALKAQAKIQRLRAAIGGDA